MRSIHRTRHRVYEALRRKGHTKESAARIANAGKTKAGRKRMAKKASRTRSGKPRVKKGRRP